MRPIPTNAVPFNPSLLKVSGPVLVGLLVDNLRAVYEGPEDAPETIGACLRLGDLEGHMLGLYGLH